MTASFIAILSILYTFVVAQDSAKVVCIAGQCVQGFTDLSLGATLSAVGASTDLLLLPGTYQDSTNPQLLHSILTSDSATLSGSPGFSNSSSISLPASIQVEPGFVFYSNSNYSNTASYISLPTTANASNITTSIDPSSFIISSNTWAELHTSSGRIIIWDASPDTSQLPISMSSVTLFQLQSGSCSTACASGGICTSQGSCACLAGFTGSSCESCQSGFFGEECQACPSDCETCDDGINGSGLCLKLKSTSQDCNCLNGECQSDGSCTCNAGWKDNTNGTKCAACSDGFFLSNDGSCKVCELGCTTCSDSTGVCTACASGFTLSSTDSTKCNPQSSVTSTGTVCPDGSFSNGTSCTACNALCSTCTGSTSNDCIVCGSGRYKFNGTCVDVDSNGICQTGLTSGNGFVADNNKKECEACPEKCTACGISSFSVASTIDQAKCTACLPGFVLSNGQCVESCPSGSFLDPKDNVTCSTCDSTCSTCAGASTFCLTCANNLLASSGSCVTSCPSNTFSSSGACVSCHPDCTTCSGTSFNQCSSCPSSRPVLSNGRCLPTCGKAEFFDSGSGSCKSCDSTCASCSGDGSNSCLSCADGNSVLRSGKCVSSSCENGTSVVSGLGTCLSDLVAIPQASSPSGTASGALPSITGIDSPTVEDHSQKLEWWQILLMALGCAFIILVLILCWRRRARKRRVAATQEFAKQKRLDQPKTWRERVVRLGEKLFGHTVGERALGSRRKSRNGPIPLRDVETASNVTGWSNSKERMQKAEEVRYNEDIDNLIDGYAYSERGGDSRVPRSYTYDTRSGYLIPVSNSESDRRGNKQNRSMRPLKRRESDLNTMSDESMYTYVTGQPRRGVDARQPVRDSFRPPIPTSHLTNLNTRHVDRSHSRFSASSYSLSSLGASDRILRRVDRVPTPAEEYALSIRDRQASPEHRPSQYLIDFEGEPSRNKWTQNFVDYEDNRIKQTYTGGSGTSRNPFRH